MTEKERKIIEGLFSSKGFMSEEEEKLQRMENFLATFPVDIKRNPKYILNLLKEAYIEKNRYDLELILTVAGKFDLFNQSYAEMLTLIMRADWHYQHEYIADLFKKYRWSEGVNALYETALTEFKYMDYDDSSSLAVRCIWALYYIGTEEAKEKLSFLTRSENEIIKKNAVERLQELEEKQANGMQNHGR